MAYLFYKVLEFFSHAGQCAPTKKVIDLIISATAMIRPHQKCVWGDYFIVWGCPDKIEHVRTFRPRKV